MYNGRPRHAGPMFGHRSYHNPTAPVHPSKRLKEPPKERNLLDGISEDDVLSSNRAGLIMTNTLDTAAPFKTTIPPQREPHPETSAGECGGLLNPGSWLMSSERIQIQGVSCSTDPASYILWCPRQGNKQKIRKKFSAQSQNVTWNQSDRPKQGARPKPECPLESIKMGLHTKLIPKPECPLESSGRSVPKPIFLPEIRVLKLGSPGQRRRATDG